MDEAIELATSSMRTRTRLQHGDVNVTKFVQMRDDPVLKRCTVDSDLICIDGMGIVLGCRLLGLKTSGRVTGIDFMLNTIDVCAKEGFRPYFLGAKQNVLDDMVTRLQRQYPSLEIAGSRNGYFAREDESDIVCAIKSSGADCLFVGITSPIKERFLNEHRDQLGVPLQIGVGGAFDVVSGHTKRAPAIVQSIGLEWLFRLLQEPHRLFYRYYMSNTVYAGILLGHIVSNALKRIGFRY